MDKFEVLDDMDLGNDSVYKSRAEQLMEILLTVMLGIGIVTPFACILFPYVFDLVLYIYGLQK